MTEVHTERDGDYKLTIFYDESPQSPRENTNLATIIGWERNYNLSDDGQPSPRYMGEDYSPLSWWASYVGVEDDSPGEAIPMINGVPVLFSCPLMLADYGSNGVKLSLTIDEWDRASGVVFVTERSWNECMGADHPKPTDYDGWKRLIVGEIEEYDDYLNGNVYGYVVEKMQTCNLGEEHAEVVDSVWGFIGDYDRPYGALAEGQVALRQYVDEGVSA